MAHDAHRVVDRQAFGHRDRSRAESGRVPGTIDLEHRTCQVTLDSDLAVLALRLNDQRHRHDDGLTITADRDRIVAAVGTKHQFLGLHLCQFGGIEQNSAARATQANRRGVVRRGDLDRVQRRLDGAQVKRITIGQRRCRQHGAWRHHVGVVIGVQATFEDQTLGNGEVVIFGIDIANHREAIRRDLEGCVASQLDFFTHSPFHEGDLDAVAHDVQGAKGVIPNHFFDTTDQLACAQLNHVFGRTDSQRFELHRQGVVAQIGGGHRREQRHFGHMHIRLVVPVAAIAGEDQLVELERRAVDKTDLSGDPLVGTEQAGIALGH